jgi:transposase
MTERERDERDLELLAALDKGLSQRKAAEMYGVTHGYVKRLVRAAKG